MADTKDTAEQKATHTPGPWHFYSGSNSVYSRALSPERNICNVSGPHKHRTPERTAERRANGLLIAAAPDLLALVYQYRDDMRHGVDGHGARGRRLEAIEAVLAKLESR